MNTTSIELPELSKHPDLWIDLLIDNELDQVQRKKLFAHCDQNPELFRKCVVRFMDHQTLESGLTAPGKLDSATPPAQKQHPKPRPHDSQNLFGKLGNLRIIGALAAAILIFALGGLAHWIGNRSHTEYVIQQAADDYEEQMTLIVDRYKEVYEIEAETKRQFEERKFKRDLTAIQLGAYRNNFLLEIENNSDRAVYYSAQRIPDFLLEALVISGHKVKIDRKTIDIKNPKRETISYPIHVVEINKNQLLRTMITERNSDVQ